MNSIRKRLLFSWSLMVALVVLLMLHHPFVAWCILWSSNLLVRQGLPRPSLSPNLQVLLLCCCIGFFAAVLINQYYVLPPALLVVGQIVEALICIPLIIWMACSDYRTFRAARATYAARVVQTGA